jgi:hypothetical protein
MRTYADLAEKLGMDVTELMTNRGLFLYYAMRTVSMTAGLYLGWCW